MPSRSTCVVTGGAGFIGCAISQDLVRQFDHVVAFDNLHPQIHAGQTRPERLHAAVELVRGDITDPADWDRLLDHIAQPDLVIHLAAETGTGQSLSEAARHTHVNVTGTAVMLDALTRRAMVPRRFVLASSRAVYGEGEWQRAADGSRFYPGQRSRARLAEGLWDYDGAPLAMTASSTKPAPVSIYGATKLAQEHVLASWCNAAGAELVTFRFQNVYGPGQSLINAYTGIVSLFCRMARRGESIPLYEDGLMIRDFVFIDDVAAAILAGARTEDLNGKVLDVGSGIPSTISDAAREIVAIHRAPAPHVCGRYRFGDVRHAYAGIDDTRVRLGWAPQTSLSDGLRKLSAWIAAESPTEGVS